MKQLMSDEWKEKAICKRKQIDFFADDLHGIKKAKSFCSQCPVAAECLQNSINFSEIYGVWGGLSQRERSKYHRLFVRGIDIQSAKEIVIQHGNKIIRV
jgi:WhiB family redox-sensing transcriptional regulator